MDKETTMTREGFMSFFRDDEKLNSLTVDDRLEIFSHVLVGSSDLTVDLLEDILADYGVEELMVIEKEKIVTLAREQFYKQMPKKKSIDVTCALILFGKKVLVVKRSEMMNMPYKWEFPGGKVEKDETEEDCIKREIKEELNIEIELEGKLTPSIHNYPTFTIKLIPFIAKYVSGNLILREHSEHKFLAKKDLVTLDWAEADVPVVNEYLEL